MIITWSGSDQYPLGEGERHHVAVVVVGVLADHIDPTRGGPDSSRLPTSLSAESLDQTAGAVAHLMHCIGGAAHCIRRRSCPNRVKTCWRPTLSGRTQSRRWTPLVVGEIEPPSVPAGWVRVQVKAAGLNRHDLWSLHGVGLPADRLPMILGCDAAGVTDDGREVIVHAVINSPDFVGSDATYDPERSLLSERYPGTFATQVWVPATNLVDKPPELSFAEAACLPTAWLTAYRMLFSQSAARPGDTVLIQGAGGGVSTALIALARQAGMRVWVTSRNEARGARAVGLGAHQAFAAGARLPERVDAVMDSVGAATWSHSINVLKPGGTLVICGATSGRQPAQS